MLAPWSGECRYVGLFTWFGSSASPAWSARCSAAFLVDDLSWRWIFYINVPIGVVALLVVASQVPGHLRRVHHVIDYLGFAVLSLAVTSLILLTSLGGTTYPWRSAPICLLGVKPAVLADRPCSCWSELASRRQPDPAAAPVRSCS